MSDLHARIIAELDAIDGLLVHKVRFVNALRAVAELHKPVTFWRPWSDEPPCCAACRDDAVEAAHVPWPCSTIQAIARELGVPTEGDHRG